MIRILHVLGKLDCGGAETLVMNWYRNIDKNEMQFDFIIHTDEECYYSAEIRRLGGKIFSVPRYCVLNHANYISRWKAFFLEHPEYRIIHGHVRSTAAIYLKIAKSMGLITIAHSHSISSGYGVASIFKYVLQRNIKNMADYFFACSWEAGIWLFGYKVCSTNKFKVIKNGIDCTIFKYDEKIRSTYRKTLKLEGRLVIGHVGRLTPSKNHNFLLKIFKEISLQDATAILLLVGDGELKNSLIAQIKHLGIEDNVIFLGVREDVNELLQAMDIFVFPSLYEGFGIATIEAQAVGLKCFFSDKVPSVTNITPNANYISLELTAKNWADKILASKKYSRISYTKQVIEHGYEIKATTNELTNFYKKIL